MNSNRVLVQYLAAGTFGKMDTKHEICQLVLQIFFVCFSGITTCIATIIKEKYKKTVSRSFRVF